MKQGAEGCAGVGLTHERFADEEGVEAGLLQRANVGGGMDAAFGDVDRVGRQAVGEAQRGFEGDLKGMEVAIVHAVTVAAEIADPGELFGGVDFTEDVKLESVGGGGEAGQLIVGERGSDEQDGVGAVGAGFDDLVLVHDEVLAEARDVGGGGCDFEVGEATLEEGLVGEDGKRGGSGVGEIAGERRGVEFGADEAFGRGSLLELGDDGRAGDGAAESGGESAGRVMGGAALEAGEGRPGAARGEVSAGLREDAVEMQGWGPLNSSIKSGSRTPGSALRKACGGVTFLPSRQGAAVLRFGAMPDNLGLTAAGSSAPQFATAEYASGPGSDTCRICGQTIVGSYYRVNNMMACASCADQAQRGQPKDSHLAYSRALLLGVGAAVLGMILYAGFAIVTEIVIGYVALAVGWLVGKAMLKGSNGIGGLRYQVTAALLTYAAVSVAAIPIYVGISIKHHEPLVRHAQTQAAPNADDSAASSDGGSSTAPATPTAPAERHTPNLLMGLAIIVGYGLASPFMELADPVHGIIGLVILAVGIRIAWRMTGARRLVVDGPYASAPAAV